MPARRKIGIEVQARVRERANYLCEYCHTSEKWQYVRFTVDHIIPFSRSGSDESDNLALSCFHCNRRKADKVTGLDPESGEEVNLYHPRKHSWNEHFIWSTDKLHIIGRSPIGCATIEVLELNRPRAIRIRGADLLIGRHPPPGDPVEEG